MSGTFTVKNYLRLASDDEERAALSSMFVSDLYGVQIKMGLVILSFQALMMGSSLLRGGLTASPRRMTYFILYAALFCVTAAFLCLLTAFHHRRADLVLRQISLSFYYSIFLCVWSCVLTLLDQHTGTNVSVFSYVLMAMAVFSILRPWQSILIFGGGFALLNGLAYFLQDNPLFFQGTFSAYSLGMNSLFVVILAIITSVTLYRYRILNRRHSDLIQSQYDQIHAINQQLSDMAMTDQLTGIGNRRCLNEWMQQLAQEQCTHPRQAVGMMLDIDYFKQYNDSFGHQAGDVCLQQIASILQQFAQREQALLVRYGGEEFFLCLLDCPDAAVRAEALRLEIVSQRLERSDLPEGCVTVSIGVDVEEDWTVIGQDAFLNRCDQALYEAKNAGRNQVCLYTHAQSN